jgi:YVTN family beta-propeller protein
MKYAMMMMLAIGLFVAGCSQDVSSPDPASQQGDKGELDNRPVNAGGNKVVVANRGSGTISVIAAKSSQVVGTFDLPAAADEPTPEPMYVVSTATHNRVFVGDRANSRVAVFNANSFAVEGTVPAGQGVFHMWADQEGRQLWVNNDIDKTTTVIDPATLMVIATVPTPADLVSMGGKPHDVILGPKGRLAYVTVLGVAGDNDYVVQFDTATFTETGRAAVGKDPHVSLARQNPWLYVPCQNSNVVIVLDRYSMEMETSIDVPGAHGAGMSSNGKFFYTTNLPGGGTDALYTIDTESNSVVGSPVDSPYAVAHNIALTANGKKLFLTHSGGASDKVTVYRMRGMDPLPQYLTEVTVGLNPFGIAFVQ